MQRNQILLVAAGVLVLGVLAIAVAALGPDRSAEPDDPAERGESRTQGAAARGEGGAARQDGPAARSATAGDPATATARGDATVTTDVIGGHAASAEDSVASAEAGSEAEMAAGGADTPMAAKGRSLGIDTDMDEDWAPQSEAAQWFEPLDTAFEAASPLTPDAFNGILGDYRETTIDVFKRSGEIADAKGADVGMAFLEEWNSLVDDYKREAYGKPPAE